ncbi:MAG: carbohydrate porin [Candidatus Omnitrophica bacterium]|nr:carbohydrate porin [Candidatus Omnitrophota bacterium]MCM8831546.1 carbohydrate porin [Candidatus Omnitrophota bacterium]
MRLIALLMLLFFCASICAAEEVVSNKQLLEEMQKLKEIINMQEKKIIELENKLNQQINQTPPLQPMTVEVNELNKLIDEKFEEKFSNLNLLKDLELNLGITGVIQATYNANSDTLSPKEDVIDATYSIDLTFLKKFYDYGEAFIHLEQGNGAGVEPHLKVFSNVNRDADNDNNVRATEVWYKHNFSSFGLPFIVKAGKLDPTIIIDTNHFANDENTQFLGRIFRNSPTIEFPDNSFGLHLFYNLKDKVELEALALNGNEDWQDTFDGMFFAGQINLKPNIFLREGNYRFYGWYNDQRHTCWLNTTKDKEGSYGFGLSFDQQITDFLGLFCRYGWQNPKVYLNSNPDFSLKQSYSLGLQLKGFLWKRQADVFGLAFGQIFPSSDYKTASGFSFKAGAENHLECYYNIKVNENLYLTFDLQAIWNPFAGSNAINSDDTIIIGGMRTHINF